MCDWREKPSNNEDISVSCSYYYTHTRLTHNRYINKSRIGDTLTGNLSQGGTTATFRMSVAAIFYNFPRTKSLSP